MPFIHLPDQRAFYLLGENGFPKPEVYIKELGHLTGNAYRRDVGRQHRLFIREWELVMPLYTSIDA